MYLKNQKYIKRKQRINNRLNKKIEVIYDYEDFLLFIYELGSGNGSVFSYRDFIEFSEVDTETMIDFLVKATDDEFIRHEQFIIKSCHRYLQLKDAHQKSQEDSEEFSSIPQRIFGNPIFITTQGKGHVRRKIKESKRRSREITIAFWASGAAVVSTIIAIIALFISFGKK